MTETQQELQKECPWEPAKVGFVTDGLFGGFANLLGFTFLAAHDKHMEHR